MIITQKSGVSIQESEGLKSGRLKAEGWSSGFSWSQCGSGKNERAEFTANRNLARKSGDVVFADATGLARSKPRFASSQAILSKSGSLSLSKSNYQKRLYQKRSQATIHCVDGDFLSIRRLRYVDFDSDSDFDSDFDSDPDFDCLGMNITMLSNRKSQLSP